MLRKLLPFTWSSIILVVLFSLHACTKLDTTSVGSELINEVDNISTFADTLSINTVQGVFEGATYQDTTKLLLTDDYAIGKNTTDPFLGQTDASLYLQLKPPFYPYYFGAPRDTVNTPDSVVLCLSYRYAYGDTTGLSGPVTLQVFEVAQTTAAFSEWDSLGTLRNVNFAPELQPTALSAPTPINLTTVKNYKRIGKGNDSVINQIRIRLTDDFKDRLFAQDSNLNGAFSRDTFFRKFTNGFAVKMIDGNVLFYTRLTDANTRLELHYKKRNAAGVVDTIMSTFAFNTGAGGTAAPRRSAVTNKIVRTRPALPTGDQELYIQAAPGTFATLTIPQLTGYTNRIVHRAEIMIEQIPDPSDALFTEPAYLYLDLVDSGTLKWKPIYFDLNPSEPYDPDNTSGFPYYPFTGEVDLTYLGAGGKKKTDNLGTRTYYTLNVTRYIQQLVTKQTRNYSIRIFAPHNIIYPQYGDRIYPYVNSIAFGRIRVGGGNNPEPGYRMRLRVIYSKLQ